MTSFRPGLCFISLYSLCAFNTDFEYDGLKVNRYTAAEIIYNRADSKKDYMGLTSWKNYPNGKILETDVVIAKNYLSKEEKSLSFSFDQLWDYVKKRLYFVAKM